MGRRRSLAREEGFSLVLIILVFAAIGLLAVSFAVFSGKLQVIAGERGTVKRMRVIEAAAVKYYQGHESLPAPSGASEVPVGPGELNLEQKYRQDAWGQPFRYDVAVNITGMDADGVPVAGYVLSRGPNQALESTVADGVSVATAGDDVLVPINVQAEAIELALREMKVLVRKLWAYACAGGPSGTPLPFLSDLINDYGLSNQYQEDPWQNDYVLTSGGVLSWGPDGSGGTADDLFLARLTKLCLNGLPAPPLSIDTWKFEEGSGGTTGSETGENEGSLEGTDVAWTTESPDGSGSALSFGGTGGYVEIPSSPMLHPDPTKLSISIWVKVSDVNTGTQPILRKWLSSDGGWGSYTIHRLANNGIMGTVQNMNSGQYPAWRTTSLTPGYWHHVVFVYQKDWDGDGEVGPEDGKIYINGQEVATTFVDSPTPYSNDFTIQYCDESYCNLYLGRQAAPAWSEYYEGLLDQVELYDSVLSAAEVREIYFASAVFRYVFHGNALDVSGNGNHGTIHGSTLPGDRFVADRFGVEGRAMSFNGTDDYVITPLEDWTGEYSVSWWIKTSDVGQDYYTSVMNNYNAPTGSLANSFQIDFDNSWPRNFRIFFNNSLPAGHVFVSFGQALTEWQHLAATYGGDGTPVKTYRNGAFFAESPAKTPSQAGALFRDYVIGRNRRGNRYYQGYIDDAVVFARRLSPQEIADEWNDYCNRCTPAPCPGCP